MNSDVHGPAQDQSVARQYDAWARVYDVFWRRYMNQTLPVAQRALAVAPGEAVLDLACGTGELLRRIATETPTAELTGVDLAPGMAHRARQKLADVPRARVESADAHDLPFPDDAFDALVCASTFHYFTSPAAVLAEGTRVLRPGGRLVVLDWCRDFWTCRVMDAVLRWVDPAHGNCYTVQELRGLIETTPLRPRYDFRYRFDGIWGMMVVEAVRPAQT